MAFLKSLWWKFIKLCFQLWSLRCLLCYLWKIQSICNVQCPMLSNDHETERTKDPLDSSSIEAEIGSQSQKPSKCFHQKSLNQVTIIESTSLVVGVIWISLKERASERTFRRNDAGSKWPSWQPVLSSANPSRQSLHTALTVHNAQCTLHTAQCTVHSALPKLLQWWWWRRTTSQSCTTSLKLHFMVLILPLKIMAAHFCQSSNPFEITRMRKGGKYRIWQNDQDVFLLPFQIFLQLELPDLEKCCCCSFLRVTLVTPWSLATVQPNLP